MSRVFKVKPKRLKKVNGLVLTPEMEVIVTTKINMSDPFSNCAKELKEAYMRLYSFDYEKACCNRGDFDTTVVYLWVSMGTICALYDAPI